MANQSEHGETLEGGWETSVRRVGEHVHRSSSPWSESVVSLLGHLETVGCGFSPRPIGTGLDADGNEVLSYIPGESLQPHPWSDEGMTELGVMLAELHDKSSSFKAGSDFVWKDWYGRSLGDSSRGFGHGDLGPWNIMAIDGCPAGFIDWDTSGPMDPVWEVAQVGWLNAQLHDDSLAERLGLGDARHRANQLKLLLDGYELARSERRGFGDKMVEVVVHDARSEVVEHSISPEAVSGVADNGYPFVWGMAWRIGGASWMLRNRHILEKAIGS